MTAIIWLILAGIAVAAIIIGARRLRHDDEMGTLSSQWLDEHRRETHQTDHR